MLCVTEPQPWAALGPRPSVEQITDWLTTTSHGERMRFVQRYLTYAEKATECIRADHTGTLRMQRIQLNEFRDAWQRGYIAGISDSLDGTLRDRP